MIRAALEFAKRDHQNRNERLLNVSAPDGREHLITRDRSSMRVATKSWLPSLPGLSRKVDVIDYCLQELAPLDSSIDEDQNNPDKFPVLHSAIIKFRTRHAATLACQAVNHHQPFRMMTHTLNAPGDILWQTVHASYWNRSFRSFLVSSCFLILIVAWALPIAFTGFSHPLQHCSLMAAELVVHEPSIVRENHAPYCYPVRLQMPARRMWSMFLFPVVKNFG